MAKNKATSLKVSDGMPSTTEFNGKTWKVVDRQIKAHFKCEGQDELKNPKSRFVKTEWLLPKEHTKELDRLSSEYDKVEMTWGWDITALFREVINENGREKDVEEYTLQRQFKNGSWDLVNPVDISNELNKPAESQLSPKEKLKQVLKWTKAKTYALYGLIAAGVLAILAVAYAAYRG